MARLIPFLMFLLFAAGAFAQTPNVYLFKTGTRTYAELAGDTPLSPANFGQGNLYTFPLHGQTFSFFGKNYKMNDTTVRILFSDAGHMQVDDDSSFVIFDGLFVYLDSIDLQSKVSYKAEGTGNNKILKVQWKNLRIRSGASDNYVNFQIWLYQANGIAEVHYGASSASNAIGYNTQSGPNVGMFYAKKDFSKMFEKIWINKIPDTYTIDSNRNVIFNAMFGVPKENTVYRFVPKQIAAGIGTIADKMEYLLSPNPVDKELTVKVPQQFTSDITLILTDVQGRTIYSKQYKPASGNVKIPTATIASGQYYLQISCGGIVQTQKIAVQH